MAITTSYPPVTVETIPDGPPSDYGLEELKEGLLAAMSAMPEPATLAALQDRHPALDAFYELRKRVAEDCAPRVVSLLADELRSRLPWTWEEER